MPQLFEGVLSSCSGCSCMSTIIMSLCWPLQGMSGPQKAVLISLADNANDEGVCWPSVARISERTCLSERTVQAAIKWLGQGGILSVRERMGRSTIYTLTPTSYAPRKWRTPQQMHHHPRSPRHKPRSSCTQNRNRTIK
ncbi:helix-turn-helix domain-containing protein [Pseudomonas poae]